MQAGEGPPRPGLRPPPRHLQATDAPRQSTPAPPRCRRPRTRWRLSPETRWVVPYICGNYKRDGGRRSRIGLWMARNNYAMDPADLEQKIRTRRAIIRPPVRARSMRRGYGRDLREARNFSDGGRRASQLGPPTSAGTRESFLRWSALACWGKVMTTGQGSFVLTDSTVHRDGLVMIINHGMVRGYDTGVMGVSLRLPEVDAAMAAVQLRRLPGFLRLRKNAELLFELPADAGGLISLPRPRKGKEVNWYLHTAATGWRNALLRRLRGPTSPSKTVIEQPHTIQRLSTGRHFAERCPARRMCRDSGTQSGPPLGCCLCRCTQMCPLGRSG